MTHEKRFRGITLTRGFVAATAGYLLCVVPQMYENWLLVPFAVVTAFFGLGIYGMLDSVAVFAESFSLQSETARIFTRVQGISGFVVGALMLTILFDHADF